MRKLLVFLTGVLLFMQQGYSQNDTVFYEGFENGNIPVGWTNSSGLWLSDGNYFAFSPLGSLKSYLGLVPTRIGDTCILETPVYDITAYQYVVLRFSHICKIASSDVAKIEYRIGMGGGVFSAWAVLPNSTYKSAAVNYNTTQAFNAGSYSQWQANNNNLVPSNSWWKEELFDLWFEAGGSDVQFRFFIQHGSVAGTSAAYGWLIDNFELSASVNPVDPPTVQLASPFVKDTVYNTGPWTISVTATSNTSAPIQTPMYLYYTPTGGVLDSVEMQHQGGSLWKGTIPQFVADTRIDYYVIGKDTFGNSTTVGYWYYIKQSCGGDDIGIPMVYPYSGSVYAELLNPGIYEIELWGADGGDPVVNYTNTTTGRTGDWGYGGYSKGTFTTMMPQTVHIYVGGAGVMSATGATPSGGGWNGGGNGVQEGRGGGGGTDIRVGGQALANRIIIAGGGGGRGRDASAVAGLGGGLVGDSAGLYSTSYIAATGGSQSAGGLGGFRTPGNTHTPGDPGTLGQGGSAQNTISSTWGGGGGGGGYFGGGAGATSGDSGGGGGGSGNTDGVSNGITQRRIDPFFVTKPTVAGSDGYARVTLIQSLIRCDTHSAAMYSIDMDDVIATSPTAQIPIVATVKNKGLSNLDSVTVSFTVNGVNQHNTVLHFVPALPWDFNHKDTVGYYNFAPNAFDTLVVWVSYPNGVFDSTTYDDTLTKIIYGTSDVDMEWIKIPNTTVYNTGTHEVTARIYSRSGNTPINAVNLYIERELNNVTDYDTLSMTNVGGNIWTVNIPHLRFGNDVTYTIKLMDYLFNLVEMSGFYHIEKSCGGGDDDHSYTGSVQSKLLQPGVYEIECWGADGGNAIHGIGGKGGYSKGTITVSSATTYYIYVGGKGTTASAPTTGGWNGGGGFLGTFSTGYNGGTGGGGTDVRTTQNTTYANRIIVAGGGGGASGYDTYANGHGGNGGGTNGQNGASSRGVTYAGGGGTQSAGGTAATGGIGGYSLAGGFGIGGDYSSTGTLGGTAGGGGYYGGGSGHWGGAGGGGSGYIGGVADAITVQATDPLYVANPDSTGNGYVRITIIAVASDCDDSNSVAMHAILSPQKSEIAGTNVPVLVSIKNMGLKDLDSCYIDWTVNGNPMYRVLYTNANGLPDGFTDTITLGSYPQSAPSDRIVVWVSMPNGVVDTITWDDTLSITVVGCSPIMGNSVITVGTGRNFSTISSAMQALKDCGVTSNITLELKGTLTENLNLSNLSDLMGNYHLTFTSDGNHPDSAVIRPASGVVATMNNTHNVTIKGITLDGSSTSTHVVDFTGVASNVVFENCVVKSSITTTSSIYCFNKTSASILDGLNIRHCKIDGAYYGVYANFTSLTSTPLITNLIIDSNEFTNQYYGGMYFNYIYPNSVSYNKITPRSASQGTTWQGIYMAYAQSSGRNCSMIGNRISANNSGITSTLQGMDIRYSDTNVLVANNEIYLNSSASTTRGIYVYYNYGTKFIHNTVLLTGSGSSFYALSWYASGSTTYHADVKNNILVANRTAAGGTAYAMFIDVDVLNYQSSYRVDYNDYYSNGAALNYTGTAYATLSLWKAAMYTDVNSINVLPSLTNPSVSLMPVGNFIPFLCPVIAPVNDDIEGNPRTASTTMGCYDFMNPLNLNATLTNLTGLQQGGSIAGQSDRLRVEVINTGTTPIDSINIEWSVNDVSKGAATYNVSLSSMGQGTTINLSPLVDYLPGDMKVKVWINYVNNYIKDDYSADDTVQAAIYVCTSGYSGVMTVGAGGTYPSIEDAYAALVTCGVGGDITFAFTPGTYNRNFDFTGTNINTARFGNHHVTITSTTNNANDVIFRGSGTAVVLLGNTSNFTIKAITVDAATNMASYGIQFNNACTNVVVRDCRVLHSTTSTSSGYYPIYKVATGISVDVSFISNVIDGGYYGWYFYGGTGSAARGKNIVFDSNTVSNQYRANMYPYYLDFASCSYNTLLSRTANIGDYWNGIEMCYVNGPIIGNRIQQRVNIIETQGIHIYYYHNAATSTDTGLVANNEIIVNNFNSYVNYAAIYIEFSRVKIIHNSIRTNGHGSSNTNPKGISINNVAGIYVYMRNNIITSVPQSSTYATYPIYFYGVGNLTQYNFDYNNLYGPVLLGGPYVGYYDGTSRALAAWRTQTGQDMNSTNWNATFVNNSNNLDLTTAGQGNANARCPAHPEVMTDINGRVRMASTTKGAYERPYPAGYYDLMAERIPQTMDKVVNGSLVSVSVDVWNVGELTLDSATFGWSINGVTQPMISYTFLTPLLSSAKTNVPIDVFTALDTTNQYDILVWIETLNNGLIDTVTWNNTASASYQVVPLASFADPLVEPTISSLSFDVYVDIFEETGAVYPTPPSMYVQTIVDNGCGNYRDTIPLKRDGGKWVATMPKQYYGSKVIYELHVSDSVGNRVDLKDSTYILPSGIGGVGGGGVVAPNMWLPATGNNSYTTCGGTVYPNLGPALGNSGGYSNNCSGYSVIYPAAKGAMMQIISGRACSESIDYVRIFDGVGTGGTMLGQFGGSTLQNIPVITSTTGPLTIYFYSDGSVNTAYNANYFGFVLDVACVGGSGDVYEGYNLALQSVVSPRNDPGNLCSAPVNPFTVALMNMGEENYDFTQDNIKIGYEIVYPDKSIDTGSLFINTGGLASAKMDTIELLPVFPMLMGNYGIRVWVESPIDNFWCDNEITSSYLSGKINLPVDKDFTDIDFPDEFVLVASDDSDDEWEVHHPDLSDPVQPDFGTGMLRFASDAGVEASFKVKQLDLLGAVGAKMEFWYYHDTANTTTEDDSYMEIVITADGVVTSVLTVYKTDVVCGWKQYIVDLTPFVAAQCVLIEFRAMNINRTGVASQYIDRIYIYAQQNLALDTILLPWFGVCDFDNKEVKMVIRNTAPLRLDFGINNTQINWEISKGTNVIHTGYHPLTTGYLLGNTSDTITLITMNLDTGIYNFIAWVDISIDDDASDDTTQLTLLINPNIAIEATANTDAYNLIGCLAKEKPASQTVTVYNRGNFDVYDIPLIVEIHDNSGQPTILQDTLPGLLKVGDSLTYTIKDSYIAPSTQTYSVVVRAELACDAYQTDNEKVIMECADMNDIAVLRVIHPNGSYDNVGDAIYPQVRIANYSPFESFQSVWIHAVISDGVSEQRLTGAVSVPAEDTTIVYTFSSAYEVPEAEEYTIIVYINKVDIYPSNDTTPILTRKTNLGVVDIDNNRFSLEQNIPNPAKNNTRIGYNLPEDGQIIFIVYTVMGQVLHIEKRDASSGKNEIEFNTINLANGIYYYSVEYKGERLVKKMTIRK